jgi:hypothetical protein
MIVSNAAGRTTSVAVILPVGPDGTVTPWTC